MWVEGFLQTNPRLQSERGPCWGEGKELWNIPGGRWEVRLLGIWQCCHSSDIACPQLLSEILHTPCGGDMQSLVDAYSLDLDGQ